MNDTARAFIESLGLSTGDRTPDNRRQYGQVYEVQFRAGNRKWTASTHCRDTYERWKAAAQATPEAEGSDE